MARLKVGLDVWQCSCGAVILMGRMCGCGKCYADVLREEKQSGKVERTEKPRQVKMRKPASCGSFIESFLFREKKK